MPISAFNRLCLAGLVTLASSTLMSACDDASSIGPCRYNGIEIPTGETVTIDGLSCQCDQDGVSCASDNAGSTSSFGDASNLVDGGPVDGEDTHTVSAELDGGSVDEPEVSVTPEGPGPEDMGPSIPEPEVEAAFGNCSEPGGERNIYDLQDPQCPDHIFPQPTDSPGVSLTLSGVVVTGIFGDTFFVQEPEGGPYSGIAVYAPIGLSELSLGDVVDLEGSYYEFYGLTQFNIGDKDDYTIVGAVTPLAPFPIVHPAHIATGGPLAEMFEGVLVIVSDVRTLDTKPDCPHEYGEFIVTGDLRVDDMKKGLWDARIGDEFASITGLLYYGFGNTKLEPRNEDDLEVVATGSNGGVTKCIESDCIAPASMPVTRQVVVNEVMVNPYGDDDAQEWIELLNASTVAVDLNGWTVRDCNEQEMVLSGNQLILEPGDLLVLGAETNPNLNGGVPVDMAYPSPFYLPNSIGSVLLYDANNTLVDQTRYSAFSPWDVLISGRSLARTSPNTDGTLPESWEAGEGSFGTMNNQGSPGAPN